MPRSRADAAAQEAGRSVRKPSRHCTDDDQRINTVIFGARPPPGGERRPRGSTPRIQAVRDVVPPPGPTDPHLPLPSLRCIRLSHQLDIQGGDLQRHQAGKIVAHSASCGWRIRAAFFQPRRGERMCRRFLSPLRGSGHTRRMPLFPQLALWATIFRPLRGLISVTHYSALTHSKLYLACQIHITPESGA